jgi:hypothetical protein
MPRHAAEPIDASIGAIHADGSVTCNADDAPGGAEATAGFYAAVVSCGAINGEGEWDFLKITATRVSRLSNGPLVLP